MLKIFSLLITACIVGCSANSSELSPQKPIDVVGQFRTKTYPISESEHVMIMDLPNRIMPTRCVVYVNESVHSTHMHCDDDGPGTAELPERWASLDR